MTIHVQQFREMKNLERQGFVEIGNDTTHPIMHIRKVPLSMWDGQMKYFKDIPHVPNIAKNLVFVGEMVEQGLQVRFNSHGCFVEDMKNDSYLVAKVNRNGRMFTLDVGI